MDADKRESTPRSHDRPQPADQAALPGGDTTPDAATQLQLLDDAHLPDWRLDASTKAIGLHGIAQARAALRTARRGQGDLPAGAAAHDGRATAA